MLLHVALFIFFFFKDLLMYFSFVLAKLHGMWDILP